MTTLQNKPTEAIRRGANRDARPRPPLRRRVIGAVFLRDFTSYFRNPAGYVFILLFVVISTCVAFWRPVFFTNNLANLDALSDWMPYLLLFFIPAITMSTWAEERRQGTDELLLTLPARDVEVVLGKYLAASGIYTAALLFALLPQIALLYSLGSPDPGVLLATYLGYWFTGGMLIAVGMVASLLASNATVAFILGGVFVAVPVFLGLVGAPLGDQARRLVEDLSVPARLRDFGTGVVPLSGVFYFVSLAAAMLFVNMVLLGRRHWAGGEESVGRWGNSVARIAALAVALASLNVLVERVSASWSRLDVTAEGLHTLSAETREIIKQIPADRPVLIQAFYSPDVPREYIETQKNLLDLLREYEARGRGKVRLNLVPTERYSIAASDAEKRFGIKPRTVLTHEQDRQATQDVFLGVAFTSGPEQVVVPFFDPGLPIEYELTRSIRVVSGARRKKVGILETDAKLLGGFDFRSMGQDTEWAIVTELKKQYNVTSVSADSPIPADVDVLLVAQPSSLTQKQVDVLTAHVRGGGATLLFVDPLPMDNPSISPDLPRTPPGGMFGGGPQPEPKGDLAALLDLLGVDWPTDRIVWDSYNPHPSLGNLPREVVFISPHSGARDPSNPERPAFAFNPEQPATEGLQEVVMLFPGLLRPKLGPGPRFIPLLRTSADGGIVPWKDAVQQSFLGISGLNPNRDQVATGEPATVAARLRGVLPAEPPRPGPDGKAVPAPAAKEARVIVVADLDLIGDQFFALRRQRVEKLDFDNVTFVLNCVDTLAGDEAFVGLRKRRPRHRTLTFLEERAKKVEKDRQAKEKEAEDQAKTELEKAQERLDKRVADIKANKDVDERTKEFMVANVLEVETNRLNNVIKPDIDARKNRAIEQSNAEKARFERSSQNVFRAKALLFPLPLPLLLAVVVFSVLRGWENRGASPNRLAT